MADKPLLKFKGDCLELQQNDCECNSWSPTGGSLFSGAKQTTSLRRRLQIGWLGLFLFLIALVSSLYLVWRWREFQEINRTHQSFAYDKELKLVSMFSRHGDRKYNCPRTGQHVISDEILINTSTASRCPKRRAARY